MTHDEQDLVRLISEYAEVAFQDPDVLEVIRRQVAIGRDDPLETRDLQVQLNNKLYGYLRARSLPSKLITPVRMAFTLVVKRLDGELPNFESEATEEFIKDQLKNHAFFWGVE